MSVKSLNSSFSLGVQSAKGTGLVTGYKTALSTVSGANPQFDEYKPAFEHPGSTSGLALEQVAVTQRTGSFVVVNDTFIVRPRILGTMLRALGYSAATTNNTTHYTHVFTLATTANAAYMSALVLLTGTAANFERKVIDIRGRKLTISGDTEKLTGVFDGLGLSEAVPGGSETKASEVDVPLSVYSGVLTAGINGDVINLLDIRNSEISLGQTLDEQDKVHFSESRVDNPVLGRNSSGKLGAFNIDVDTYLAYKGVNWGSAAGTGLSNVMPVGSLVIKYQSLANISGAAVPYSLNFSYPSVEWRLSDVNSSGQDLVRPDLNWVMYGEPPVITLVNDVAAYT